MPTFIGDVEIDDITDLTNPEETLYCYGVGELKREEASLWRRIVYKLWFRHWWSLSCRVREKAIQKGKDMQEIAGSVMKHAQAALIIELHDDGTYDIVKNRHSSAAYINQMILVREDGLVKQVKRGVWIWLLKCT